MAVKRLSKVAREFNIGINTIVDYLKNQGINVESNPNTKLDEEAYDLLVGEFQSEKNVKEESKSIKTNLGTRPCSSANFLTCSSKKPKLPILTSTSHG